VRSRSVEHINWRTHSLMAAGGVGGRDVEERTNVRGQGRIKPLWQEAQLPQRDRATCHL